MVSSQLLKIRKRTKMDFARAVAEKHPELVLPRTNPKYNFPQRLTLQVLLFWAQEDKWLGETFKKYPQIFERMCKLTTPFTIIAYFDRIANHNGMFKTRGSQRKGVTTLTIEQAQIRLRESNKKSHEKYDNSKKGKQYRIRYYKRRNEKRKHPQERAKIRAYDIYNNTRKRQIIASVTDVLTDIGVMNYEQAL